MLGVRKKGVGWDGTRPLKIYFQAILTNVVMDHFRASGKDPLVFVEFREPDQDSKGGFSEPVANDDTAGDVILNEEYVSQMAKKKEQEDKYVADFVNKGQKTVADVLRRLFQGLAAPAIVQELRLKNNQQVWNIKERYYKPFCERTGRTEQDSE